MERHTRAWNGLRLDHHLLAACASHQRLRGRLLAPRNGGGGYYLSREDGEELARLLGLPARVHPQDQSIPTGNDYYQEYVDRAEGRRPTVHGKPYWD